MTLTSDNRSSRNQPVREGTAADVANLAAGLAEPARTAEVAKHHAALLRAMNSSVDAKGEQDALCAFEAIAILLGQMTGGAQAESRPGILSYITHRALFHAARSDEAGEAARFEVEPDDMGQEGHA